MIIDNVVPVSLVTSYTLVSFRPILVLTGDVYSKGNASLDPLELPLPDTAMGPPGELMPALL